MQRTKFDKYKEEIDKLPSETLLQSGDKLNQLMIYYIISLATHIKPKKKEHGK